MGRRKEQETWAEESMAIQLKGEGGGSRVVMSITEGSDPQLDERVLSLGKERGRRLVH